MPRITRILCFSFVFSLLLMPAALLAQDVGDVDFESLDAEDLSDAQIKRIWSQAQEKGMSLSELQNLARQRGMAASEVSELTQRLKQIQSGTGQQSGDEEADRDRSGGQDQQEEPPDEAAGGADGSRIFGYSLFNQTDMTFAPTMRIPTPEDYQLGPGDQIIIDIWGSSQGLYQKTISPEGTIQIDNLGPIYLNGLSIEEARSRLKEELSQIYAGLDSDSNQQPTSYFQVTLGEVRSIDVTVLGEVKQPGTYTVSSLATAYNALYSAGGPNRIGTFRDIKVIRDNEVVARLDIYDFLIEGTQKNNIRLQHQDVIKVDPYLNRVDLTGETKRTGLFELTDGESLAHLIRYGGGFTSSAYTYEVTVHRKTSIQQRILNVSKPQYEQFNLQNGDSVQVGQIFDAYENRVQIQGAVFKPGSYELHDTTTVHSLVQRALGLRGDAFTKRALIYRTLPNNEIKTIPFNLGEVMQNSDEHDFDLQKDDIIQISSIFDMRQDAYVEVNGAVINPGQYSFVNDMSLEDVIFRANGFQKNAAPYRIEVARRISGDSARNYTERSAKIHEFQIRDSLELVNRQEEFTLEPFDQVYVRSAPGYETQKEVTISGQVLYPGTYTISSRNMRISDLIDRAGGLTPDAYPQGAHLSRINRAAMGTQEDVPDSLRQQAMDRTPVGIELPNILDRPDSPRDLLLKEGDQLTIPKELQTVMVQGEVLNPVSVRHSDGNNLRDYIASAGGFTEQARSKKTYVVYANGEVDQTGKFLFFRNYPDVRPGATIYVPAKPERDRMSTGEIISLTSAVVSMAAIVSQTINQLSR